MLRRRLIPLVVFSSALMGTALAVPAHGAVTAFSTVMTGSQERPGPGDPDAIGSAIVTLDSTSGEVCVRFHLRNVDPITVDHIHRGPAGVAGPVVIPLPVPVGDFGEGCTTASPALVQDIVTNPANYYVNVHNAAYPGGAMRGQL